MDPERMSHYSLSKQSLAKKAIAYLQSNYTEKFSLDEMAAALFVNKYYLARIFKEVTGTTPLHYNNQLRCEKAAALLADPHLSVTGIALRTGFTSVSHFSRVFKRCKGCTPSEYRRSPVR